MKTFPSVTWIALAVALLIPSALVSQITITSSDLQRPVGYWVQWGSTIEGSVPVDLGSTGGPQSWDFTSYDVPSIERQEFVDPPTTPFASDFPTANQCGKNTNEGSSDEEYDYIRLESSTYGFLGFGVVSTETTFVYHFDPALQISLPVSMGSSWTWELVMVDTVMGVPISETGIRHSTVDAYGTMTVPGGTFDALRTVSFDTTITTSGVPPFQFSDTTTTISYNWFGRDPFDIAEVTSAEGETDPNFTDATSVWVNIGHGLGIGDDGGEIKPPVAFRLAQNTPNPFNPMTTISFELSEDGNGRMELAVFSVRGKKVRTILSGDMTPGEYSVSWDGKNDRGEPLPSGVYLYRLTSGGESLIRKMVMAK